MSMVWGAAFAKGSGDFTPSGLWTGWDEKLTAYFNRMPAEQKRLYDDGDYISYKYFTRMKFVEEFGSRLQGYPPIGRIEAHEAPNRFETMESYTLGSLIRFPDYLLAVDERLKNSIERLEPEVHCFFPIEILTRWGVPYPDKYFVMVIGQFRDSFSPKQSDPNSWIKLPDGRTFYEEKKRPMSGLALSGEIFGGAHLWRERRMSNPLICFSDELITQIDDAGLFLPKFYPLEEIGSSGSAASGQTKRRPPKQVKSVAPKSTKSSVWGVALPGTFGGFFPSGEYVGWDEQLTEYFDTKMPVERKALFDCLSSYRYYVAENFNNEAGLERPQMPPFGSIVADEAPKRFKIEKNYPTLGSLMKLNCRILAVDEDFREIVERLEPGMHQFFPIEIVMPGNRLYRKKYFVMAIGQWLDSFSPEQSDPASWRKNGLTHYFIWAMNKPIMSGLAFSREVFGGAHLWRERRITHDEFLCFSDRLITECLRLGLNLPKHCRLKEI